MPEALPKDCEFCERELPLTFHHLIPRTLHTNKWFKKKYTRDEMKKGGVYLCRDCHSAVHRFVPSEKALGRSYNTAELLLEHPEIAKFVKWISKRNTSRVRMRVPNSARSNER